MRTATTSQHGEPTTDAVAVRSIFSSVSSCRSRGGVLLAELPAVVQQLAQGQAFGGDRLFQPRLHAAGIAAQQRGINPVRLRPQALGSGVVAHPARRHPAGAQLRRPQRSQQGPLVAAAGLAHDPGAGHLAEPGDQGGVTDGGVGHARRRAGLGNVIQSRLGDIQADVMHRFGQLCLVMRVHDSVSGSSLTRHKTAARLRCELGALGSSGLSVLPPGTRPASPAPWRESPSPTSRPGRRNPARSGFLRRAVTPILGTRFGLFSSPSRIGADIQASITISAGGRADGCQTSLRLDLTSFRMTVTGVCGSVFPALSSQLSALS